MPTHVEIEPLRELLRADWAALDELCAPLSEQQWATPTCLPGWTVQDVLAHIAGTELMLDGVEAPEVDVSHLTHLRNDIARMGEVWVQDMRSLSGPQVLDRFREVTGRRGAALDEMTQARLRRAVVDAGRQGRDLREVHADPPLRQPTCTSTTSVMRSAHRTVPMWWPSSRRWPRSRGRWATSSGARLRCPTGPRCASI